MRFVVFRELQCRPNGKLRYRYRLYSSVHCSDKNAVLTTGVAGARAHPSQYLCSIRYDTMDYVNVRPKADE